MAQIDQVAEQAPEAEPTEVPQGPAKQIPIVDYLVLAERPHLRAHECESCSGLYFDRRNACGRCGERVFRGRDLQTTGTVRAFTLVRRAPAKIRVPYVSVVVDLDGGGTVKGNLIDVPAEAAAISPRMPVELTTWCVASDDEGTEAVAFGFRPIGASR